MSKAVSIAIDGPAGAGKSTIARLVAGQLCFLYLDTGAMYRAIGLKALRLGVDMRDEAAVSALLDKTALDIRFTKSGQRVLLDGTDVAGEIRSAAVSRAASDVSALPVVRVRLVALQRELAERQNLVIDGRDIGTYVLPQATYKFFLTADVEERARRRLADLRARGDGQANLATVLADVRYRDKQDSERALAPLRQADDAILIDSTGRSIEEVVDLVLRHINRPEHDRQYSTDR